MTRDQIQEMIMLILGQADYDLAKSFDPDTAEEPDYAASQLEDLTDKVERFIKKINKSKK